MSLGLSKVLWEPTASVQNLRLRAKTLATIRHFFAERAVMEVETPVLSQHTVTDPYIESFQVPTPQAGGGVFYLQTSPEYAMKRLLAAGSGCIYQICKAFRVEENGKQHSSEFSMLEWYRIGFNHYDLMDEVEILITSILNTPPTKRCTYAQLFQDYLSCDIFTESDHELRQRIVSAGWLQSSSVDLDRDTCLQLLMNHALEPFLGYEQPLFIYDFPASQAALARISSKPPFVAERFELYIQGMEIANGFHELTDANEQNSRFLQDQQFRQKQGKRVPPADPYLLAALRQGLPECAGVALGLDRLIMIKADADHIKEVLAFA